MAKSFLQRIEPSRQRWKLVDWPFPVEGERPKVKLRALGQNEAEQAYLAAADHFGKRKLPVTDPGFMAREQAELVWRAYSDNGEPLAESTDEMVKEPKEVIDQLYATFAQFVADVAAPPPTSKDLEALVDLLKKNIPADLLLALPSSWLIGLITTLASPHASSTQANEDG